MSFEPLVLGDMRFVVRCSREAVGTYLADERFDRQVDLGDQIVITAVGKGMVKKRISRLIIKGK